MISTVRIYSEHIKMEFGLSKYAMLIMKRGKLVRTGGIAMPDGDCCALKILPPTSISGF